MDLENSINSIDLDIIAKDNAALLLHIDESIVIAFIDKSDKGKKVHLALLHIRRHALKIDQLGQREKFEGYIFQDDGSLEDGNIVPSRTTNLRVLML